MQQFCKNRVIYIKQLPLARTYNPLSASLKYSHDAMKPWQRAVKRGADIVSSLLGLVILSPFFAGIAIAMKMQKNGPVIFSQKRIGRHGRPFTIYKFRTLSTVVEDEGPQLIAQSDSVRSTPFEKFLRDHLWAHAQSENTTSTKSWSRPTTMCSSMRCDRD